MSKGDVMGPETAMVTAGAVDARHGHEVERMRRQIEVMLAHALDRGLTPAPGAWMFDAVRETPLVDLSGEGWSSPLQEPGRRHGTDALVQAHRELSRLVAPARPASLETLQAYRDARKPTRTARIPRQQARSGTGAGSAAKPKINLRKPRLPGVGSSVPLVRWLTVAALAFLALFVVFAASPEARVAVGGETAATESVSPSTRGAVGSSTSTTGSATVPAQGGSATPGVPATSPPSQPAATTPATSAPAAATEGAAESFGSLLLRELFLLSAAGLGACLIALYRASREVSRGTYDPEFDHTFIQRIVLGMAVGLILAELVPVGGEPGTAQAVLGPPAVALIGGFAASVVHRVLSRIVSALETLFSGDPDEQEESRRALAQKRADEVLAQAERATLAKLLEIRRIAASGAPTRAVIDEIDHMITHVTPT